MNQLTLIQPPAVYVDECVWPFRRMLMCHMLADRLDDLHAMADQIGVARRWFQGRRYPHYDICKTKRALAVKLGAIEIDRRQFVRLAHKLMTGQHIRPVPHEPGRYWVPCESDPTAPPWLVDLNDNGVEHCSCQIIHNRTESRARCKHIQAVRVFLKLEDAQKYATAQRDGYTVPLIGVPASAQPSTADFRNDPEPL